MKRAALDRPLVLRRYAWHRREEHGQVCACEGKPGLYRKRKPHDCGKTRCFLCHGDKLWSELTRQERRARCAEREVEA